MSDEAKTEPQPKDQLCPTCRSIPGRRIEAADGERQCPTCGARLTPGIMINRPVDPQDSGLGEPIRRDPQARYEDGRRKLD